MSSFISSIFHHSLSFLLDCGLIAVLEMLLLSFPFFWRLLLALGVVVDLLPLVGRENCCFSFYLILTFVNFHF